MYNDYYQGYQLNEGVFIYALSDSDISVLDEAIYIIDNKVSLRYLADNFCRSKSALHRDLSINLKSLSWELFKLVEKQLKENKKKYFS